VDGALTHNEHQYLNALNLAHVRLDLMGSNPEGWRTLIETRQRIYPLNLEIAVHLSDNAAEELKALRAAVEELQP
jgi:hypothetical protein